MEFYTLFCVKIRSKLLISIILGIIFPPPPPSSRHFIARAINCGARTGQALHVPNVDVIPNFAAGHARVRGPHDLGGGVGITVGTGGDPLTKRAVIASAGRPAWCRGCHVLAFSYGYRWRDRPHVSLSLPTPAEGARREVGCNVVRASAHV